MSAIRALLSCHSDRIAEIASLLIRARWLAECVPTTCPPACGRSKSAALINPGSSMKFVVIKKCARQPRSSRSAAYSVDAASATVVKGKCHAFRRLREIAAPLNA
jgi:hypothetical protein